MSKSNNKIFKYVNKSPKKKQPLSELILTTLNDVELRTKSMKIKEIKIKENIRSIKLKEKKYNKINEEITTRKQELKLLKELLFFKEQKKLNPDDMINSYLDFFISSNFLLDDKLNSLIKKEINLNKKQKIMNKLIGNKINDDYDYNIPIIINMSKNFDISKFYLKPKKQKKKDANGDNLDNFFMNHFNNNNYNNNVIRIQRNNYSSGTSHDRMSNGINNGDDKKYTNNFNIIKNKDLTKFQKFNKNTIDVSKFIMNNKNSYNKINKDKLKNEFNEAFNFEKNKESNGNKVNNPLNNYSKTDINDYPNYNLKPSPKLRKARETFKKLLNKMNKSNIIMFSTNKTDDIKNFILYVLNTSYFLKKILYLCYEAVESYNISKQKNIETIYDSEFLSKLIENYEDVGEEYDLQQLNNFKAYEKGLEEIKKITLETKQLEDEINQFAKKINVKNGDE